MRWPNFKDLLTGHKSCRKGKKPSAPQIAFEQHLGANLLSLHRDIHNCSYATRPAQCFVVARPKPREIFAADYRDRIIHHLIISKLEPLWEKQFSSSSFACRKGLGPHHALRMAQQRVSIISQGGAKSCWALQLDIKTFFSTIHRPTLTSLLKCNALPEQSVINFLIDKTVGVDSRKNAIIVNRHIHRKVIRPEKSWFNQPPDKGIPIGNLTSQFGANVYLDGLDKFIEHKLKPAGYIRYVDDLLLLDACPQRLGSMIQLISEWLFNHRHQTLQMNKTKLTELTAGIFFLGYRLRCDKYDAKNPLQVFHKSNKKWEFIKAIKGLENTRLHPPLRNHWLGPIDYSAQRRQIQPINARLGTMAHSRTYTYRKQALNHLKHSLTDGHDQPQEVFQTWEPLIVSDDYLSIKLR
ncbi:MAG: group II intron reverse transcriptase domain-containing protein [Bdellovibrionales bacterium]|nr:group II intron reverse transcriptase domain-containing protein [Bdellovibrionales bacterium]